MWTIKSRNDISAEQKAHGRKKAVLVLVCWVTLLFLIDDLVLAGRLGLSRWFPKALGILPDLFAAAVAGLALAAYVRLNRLQRMGSKAWVCSKCGLLKCPDDEEHCRCGGTFASLGEMQWSARCSDAPMSPPQVTGAHDKPADPKMALALDA